MPTSSAAATALIVDSLSFAPAPLPTFDTQPIRSKLRISTRPRVSRAKTRQILFLQRVFDHANFSHQRAINRCTVPPTSWRAPIPRCANPQQTSAGNSKHRPCRTKAAVPRTPRYPSPPTPSRDPYPSPPANRPPICASPSRSRRPLRSPLRCWKISHRFYRRHCTSPV